MFYNLQWVTHDNDNENNKKYGLFGFIFSLVYWRDGVRSHYQAAHLYVYYLCSVSVFLKGLSHVELEDYKHKSPKTGEKKKERTISYD